MTQMHCVNAVETVVKKRRNVSLTRGMLELYGMLLVDADCSV